MPSDLGEMTQLSSPDSCHQRQADLPSCFQTSVYLNGFDYASVERRVHIPKIEYTIAPEEGSVDSARIFKALGHETRLRTMTLLTARPLCVCHLEAALGLSQVAVSRHLAVLRAAGLVESKRDGLWVHYRLVQARTPLQALLFDWLRSRLRSDKAMRQDVARMRECVEMPLEEVAAMVHE